MKDIELPPLSKFDHPEPRTMQWSDLELYAIKSYARAAVEADRAQRVPDGWANLLKAAREVLSWTQAADRPPVRDKYECGRMTGVRVHALADLHEAVQALASTPAPAQQEPSEAEMVCAEAYQVVGCLLSDLGLFETEAARKILDNLSEARRVHQDVLPWESAATAPLLAEIGRLTLELEEARKDAERLTNEQIDAGIKAWFSTDITINEGKDRGHPFRQRMRAAIRAAIKEQA